MKKTMVYIVLILAGVFIFFTMLNLASDFAAERALYKIMKTNTGVPIDFDGTMLGAQKDIEERLRKTISRFPKTKSAKRAYLSLATLYLGAKRYDDAISVSDEILAKYKDDAYFASNALFIKAKSYEMKNEWPEALEVLDTLKSKYLLTPLGLQAAFYVADYYRLKGYSRETRAALNQAIASYNNLEENNKGTILGYTAAEMLIKTYLSFEQYENAGEALERMLYEYPGPMTYAQKLPLVEPIFVEKLNRPEEAARIYRFVLEKTNNEKLKKSLQKKIKELEKTR